MGLHPADLGTTRVAHAPVRTHPTTAVRATARAKDSGSLPPPPTVRTTRHAPRAAPATRSAPVNH